MTSPRLLVAVAAGGAIGALLRWWLTDLFPDDVGFAWTTFAINVSGTFALACLPVFAVVERNQLLDAAIGPGLLGGYTTLSTYSEQARSLLAEGRPVVAAAYLLGTLAACLAAAALARPIVHGRPHRAEEHR